MVSYFDSQHTAQGEKFISRSDAARALADQIKQKKFSTLYSAPGFGKKTLVDKALRMLREEAYPTTVITMDLYNITSSEALSKLYVNAFRRHIEEYNRDALLPIRMDFDNLSFPVAINLPELVGSITSLHPVVYFKEFQNILTFSGGEKLLKLMEKEFQSHKDVAYIVTGEQVNKMKDIFEKDKFFYRINANIAMEPLGRRDSLAYMRGGFLRSGKDLEAETGEALYNTAKGNPLVMNRLAALCDTLAPGYINKRILNAAVESYFNDQESRYRFITGNLTDNQINFLRAVCDGVQRFSSSEILKKYHLNSSANVFRLKEALSKKEIVTFDAEERASVIDPMFELWLKRRYFA